MERQIFGIGTGRYKFDKKTLSDFLEESRSHLVDSDGNAMPSASAESHHGSPEEELRRIFDEVLALYRDYMRSESVDLLVRLKCKLEEVSIRYRSHVLAEEVLNINRCLPYERRVPRDENRH